ncbi:protein bdm [Salmonella enterica subsp. enterica serovar Choleraesuis]|nr:protein bdm [Salmonella enterica subsp. enterica serovar Choleraesuis]
MSQVARSSVVHHIPAEYISESVLLKIIESDLLLQKGYVAHDDVVSALMKNLESEQNVILNDIYRQTLEFVICAGH